MTWKYMEIDITNEFTCCMPSQSFMGNFEMEFQNLNLDH